MTPSSSHALTDAVAQILAEELGDSALGHEVAHRLDQRAMDALALMPASDRSAVLSYSPRIEPEPQALVVFAFGNRFASNRNLLPGPVNLVMAGLADAWATSTGLPVFAQWEVADEMQTAAGRVGVVELDNGSVEYLSTAGVADQIRGSLVVDRVAVLAMADHAVRCCRTLERAGFAAGVPAEVTLPTTYDSDSGQPWTRDRASYLAIDILARCLT